MRMSFPIRGTVFFVALHAAVLASTPALAQNWSFDARNIGLGGVGSTSNIAVDMVDEQRPYRAIVLPFGLLQILPNLPKLDPTKPDFDLVRAIEYTASPIHYIIGRNDTESGQQFVTDIRNGTLSRDLNVYRGFEPATSLTAEGLASPSWGGTIKLHKGSDGSFQGVYVGAGPYLSMQTSSSFDPALAGLLASPTPAYLPNTSFYISNQTLSQFALAITGGYRARLAWPSGGRGALDGLYLGANYHYLHGFRYENFAPNARLDTNAQGLLTFNPALGLPVTIVRSESTSGTGFAIDMGVAAVLDRWEVGFGVNGIANRIDWKNVELTNYVLNSLFTGGAFVDLPAVPVADARVELPVDIRTNLTYNAPAWTVITEFGHGYNGTSFRGGYEQRIGNMQLRGGGRYVNERWEPTGGAGFNLSPRFGIDVAAFGTSANLERKRHVAIATSLRFMRRSKP
jgi:hypothetical protein